MIEKMDQIIYYKVNKAKSQIKKGGFKMVLKDLLKSITKSRGLSYWFHIFKGKVHIGTIELNYNNTCITLNSMDNYIINVLGYEVESFKLHEEFEFIITIK